MTLTTNRRRPCGHRRIIRPLITPEYSKRTWCLIDVVVDGGECHSSLDPHKDRTIRADIILEREVRQSLDDVAIRIIPIHSTTESGVVIKSVAVGYKHQVRPVRRSRITGVHNREVVKKTNMIVGVDVKIRRHATYR